MELYVLVPNFWKALQSWWREEVDVLDGEGVDVRLEGAQEGGEVQERRLHAARLITTQPDGSVLLGQ